MFERLARFIREYIIGFSIVTIIIGLFFLFMGVIWYWIQGVELGFYTDLIYQLEEWNAYLLVLGLVLFAIGAWYLYSYHTKKKFVLEELRTNKRSELLKRHKELQGTVKHLPSKYKQLLTEKERDLRIK